MNILVSLIQSTNDLHNRFGTAQTVEQSLNYLAEEYNEVIDAVSSSEPDIENLKEEIVDVIVTLVGVVKSMFTDSNNTSVLKTMYPISKIIGDVYLIAKRNKITSEDLQSAMQVVINKNNAKTLETHYVNKETGKITRIGK